MSSPFINMQYFTSNLFLMWLHILKNSPAGLNFAGSTTRGSFSWGTAEMIEAGMGGIVVVFEGSLANSEASIWFFSHNLLLPPLLVVLGPGELTCGPGRRSPSNVLLEDPPPPSSPSSLGRLRVPIREETFRALIWSVLDGDEGVGFGKPSDVSRGSSVCCCWPVSIDIGRGFRSSSCFFSSCCNNSFCFWCSRSSSSLFSLSSCSIYTMFNTSTGYTTFSTCSCILLPHNYYKN